MTTSTVTGTPENQTDVEYNKAKFLQTAAVYRRNKQIVDAASRFDNIEDAITGLKEAYEALENQIEHGGEYTPSRDLGFGSDSATVIAESLLGRRGTVTETRKAFAKLGK